MLKGSGDEEGAKGLILTPGLPPDLLPDPKLNWSGENGGERGAALGIALEGG